MAPDDVGAREEAAHGVAENEDRQGIILLAQALIELAHVADDELPAAVLSEITEVLGFGDAQTVAEMVVPRDDEAVRREVLGKVIIAADMLGNAVAELHNADRLTVRQPLADVNRIFAVAGGKTEFVKYRHDRTSLQILMTACLV